MPCAHYYRREKPQSITCWLGMPCFRNNSSSNSDRMPLTFCCYHICHFEWASIGRSPAFRSRSWRRARRYSGRCHAIGPTATRSALRRPCSGIRTLWPRRRTAESGRCSSCGWGWCCWRAASTARLIGRRVSGPGAWSRFHRPPLDLEGDFADLIESGELTKEKRGFWSFKSLKMGELNGRRNEIVIFFHLSHSE